MAYAVRAANPAQSWHRLSPPLPPAARAPDCRTRESDSEPRRGDRGARQTLAQARQPLFADCHTSCAPEPPSLSAPVHRRPPPPDLRDFAHALRASLPRMPLRARRGRVVPSRHRRLLVPRRILFRVASLFSIPAPYESPRRQLSILPARHTAPTTGGIPSSPVPSAPW